MVIFHRHSEFSHEKWWFSIDIVNFPIKKWWFSIEIMNFPIKKIVIFHRNSEFFHQKMVTCPFSLLNDGFQTHLDEPNGADFDGVAWCTTPTRDNRSFSCELITLTSDLCKFLCIWMYTGWWYTYPSEKYESQWEGWHPIYYGKTKHVPNLQPDIIHVY